MTSNRPAPNSEAASGHGWSRFWLAPADPAQLHRIRFLGGLLFVAWMLSFAGNQESLLSLAGWVDATAYVEGTRLEPPPPVPIGWSAFYLAGTNRAAFDLIYWGLIFATGLFTLGLMTRITGILTWVAVVSFLSNPATSYDADFLFGILAFYLMIGYLFYGFWNGGLSFVERIIGPYDAFVLARRADAVRYSYAANVTLRLIQIHFAIIVVVGGLHKLQFSDWWAGVAFWYPLHSPFTMTREKLEAAKQAAGLTLGLLSFVQYLFVAWEIAFPVFAWRRGWARALLIGGAVLRWGVFALIMGLPWFGPFYLVCCLSYLHADEWQRVRGVIGRIFGAREATPARAAAGHKVTV